MNTEWRGKLTYIMTFFVMVGLLFSLRWGKPGHKSPLATTRAGYGRKLCRIGGFSGDEYRSDDCHR